VQAVMDHELRLGTYLHIISWLKLAVQHMVKAGKLIVIFHSPKNSQKQDITTFAPTISTQ